MFSLNDPPRKIFRSLLNNKAKYTTDYNDTLKNLYNQSFATDQYFILALKQINDNFQKLVYFYYHQLDTELSRIPKNGCTPNGVP